MIYCNKKEAKEYYSEKIFNAISENCQNDFKKIIAMAYDEAYNRILTAAERLLPLANFLELVEYLEKEENHG